MKEKIEFSKSILKDTRSLLWIVTVGGVLLGFYAIFKDSMQSLPWITTLVGFPWGAHATACAFYFNKAKAENTIGGIKYDSIMQEIPYEDSPII